MQPSEAAAILPAEYLKEGFFDAGSRLREGLNGYYSLGVAYRLKYEGVGPEALKGVVDRLTRVGEANLRSGPDAASRPLSDPDHARVKSAWAGIPASAVLEELRSALVPLMMDWKAFGAGLLHLERIMKQLALLQATPAPTP